MSKKYVITGGPCTGKTTTIEALKKEGFQVVQEASRRVISEQQAIGSKILPWINLPLFEWELLKTQLMQESEIDDSSDAFIDHGFPTILAYSEFADYKVPDKMLNIIKSNRYDKVFLLEPLGIWENDAERKEDAETGKKLHELVKKAYQNEDYQVISVPPVSVEKRVAFIKKHIKD